MITIHSPLDELDEVFRVALANDPEPASKSALLWHEAVSVDRNPLAPKAITRGGAFLEYVDGSRSLNEVPGQEDIPDEKLPHETCSKIISDGAADWDAPIAITFRYDQRDDGKWEGGYSTETSNERRKIVLGRAGLDAAFTAALQEQWTSSTAYISFLYGVSSWKDPGPKLKRKDDSGVTFGTPSEKLMRHWNELIDYLQRNGMRHVYYADFMLRAKDGELREGSGVELRYSR